MSNDIWQIVGATDYRTGNAERPRGWRVDLERIGDPAAPRHMVSVELVGTVAITDYEPTREWIKDALDSQGRTAVRYYLAYETPPECLYIDSRGIHTADDCEPGPK